VEMQLPRIYTQKGGHSVQTHNQINNVPQKQNFKCPECGSWLKITKIGLKEEAECPGCGYLEVSR